MHTALIRRRRGGTPFASYMANGFTPQLVVDPVTGRYAYGGQLRSSFSDVVTFARSGTATYFDSNGTLQTAADGVPRLASHVYEADGTYGPELVTNGTFDSGTTGWTASGVAATVVSGEVNLQGGTGHLYQAFATTVGDLYQVSGEITQLGGVFTAIRKADDSAASVNVVNIGTSLGSHSGTFEATATTTYILLQHNFSATDSRFDNISLKGPNKSWVNKGLLVEPAAAIQLLHGTNAFATQTETVTAQAYTLQFRGTGSIALTGAHTATLNGTGANDLVSLTFTPSAGTLTLTPSGTVTYPQLETGSTPSSYIPNAAGSGTATRNAETATIAAAKLPYNATAMSIAMRGVMTGASSTLSRWYADANNYITLSTGASDFTFAQAASGTVDSVTGGSYTSGVNVPFSIASRHGSTFVNGAIDGTALTADTTPTALPDTSATDLQLASTGIVTVSRLLMWDDNIADAGIEAAST